MRRTLQQKCLMTIQGLSWSEITIKVGWARDGIFTLLPNLSAHNFVPVPIQVAKLGKVRVATSYSDVLLRVCAFLLDRLVKNTL